MSQQSGHKGHRDSCGGCEECRWYDRNDKWWKRLHNRRLRQKAKRQVRRLVTESEDA